MAKRLTIIEKEEIINLYKTNKYTFSSLSLIYEVTPQSIRQLLNKNNLFNDNKIIKENRKPRRFLKDLTGLKIGRLTCLEREIRINKNNKRISFWKCQCDCGNLTTVRLISLSHNSDKNITKSCGCYHKEYKRVNSKTYGESSFNKYFHNIKKSAEKRNYIFNLTQKEVKILNKQNCYYCGVKPKQITGESKLNGKYIYNGIDRVDNFKGYELSNCVACCGICNKMKLTSTKENFINQCILIAKNHA
jgi:hypothetical protein